MTSLTPQTLRALREERMLEIVWPDQRTDRLSFYDLRCACPCAVCVDEITGRPLLKRDTVPQEIHAVAVSFVGNYALRVEWSDKHSTGIYTWDRLRDLGNTLS